MPMCPHDASRDGREASNEGERSRSVEEKQRESNFHYQQILSSDHDRRKTEEVVV
jgi:hypothetical protein